MARRSLLPAALLLLPALAAAQALPPGAAEAAPEMASHVVVAVVDTGINPYHREFLDAARTAHPSTYLTGYPADAQPLALCLDAAAHPDCAGLAGARAHDAGAWAAVERTEPDGEAWEPLYYVPGTRIVGAVSVGAERDAHVRPTRVLDDLGHGTAVASLAAGRDLGMCPECLLVIVEGPGDEALAWAAAQPWIDLVTNSWGWQANLGWPPPPVGYRNGEGSLALAQQGKTVLFSAGNGLGLDTAPGLTDAGEYLLPGETTYTSEYAGPDWVVTVGAVDPANGQPIAGTARPVDVSAAALDVRAADGGSRSGTVEFDGTSAAAPLVAGAFGQVLLQARRALGDAAEGPRAGQVLAQGAAPATAAAGPLADGALTRAELQRLLFATAQPCPGDPLARCEAARAPWPFPMRAWGWTLPTPPLAYPMLTGYGTVTAATRDAAARAALGLEPLPPRPEADLWARSDSVLRQHLWGAWQDGASLGDLLP